MIFFRFRQYLARLDRKVSSAKNQRKMGLAAMIGIIFLLIFSLYFFIMDLVMGYSQQEEAIVLQARHATSVQTETQPKQEIPMAEETPGPAAPATPQSAATPVPANGR